MSASFFDVSSPSASSLLSEAVYATLLESPVGSASAFVSSSFSLSLASA